MARMVTLEEWARDEFGTQAPGRNTLKMYAKSKMMAPPAVKVGRKWMIDCKARFTGIAAKPKIAPDANRKLRRIIEDVGQTTKP